MKKLLLGLLVLGSVSFGCDKDVTELMRDNLVNTKMSVMSIDMYLKTKKVEYLEISLEATRKARENNKHILSDAHNPNQEEIITLIKTDTVLRQTEKNIKNEIEKIRNKEVL